ncbi:protein phosphatase 2C-related protein [Dictyostelium discoideum AX4]|uniref:Protein phosphatase 2C-related protein n=1 Tax=Dictyostelium discoideum TaxID=44689 RepID=Q54VY2_DICDI|nr:protein phosphatase 2C-related protein [Dictyostelium discoideum AX4]EAL67260.1 protein phosphatase 2C-related protein [Dictyostelium discoideum AX4]|eukprot:XP_641223.1 protein phosphatase 2C-related protein [Dictyostelium discoideum AX4]
MNQFKLVNSIIKETLTKSSNSVLLKSSQKNCKVSSGTINNNIFRNSKFTTSNLTLTTSTTLNTKNSIFNFEQNKKTLGCLLFTTTFLFNSTTTNNDSIKTFCTNTTTTTTTTTTNNNNNNSNINIMIDTMTINDASAASTSSTVAEDCLSTTIDATATITDTTTNHKTYVDEAMQDREMRDQNNNSNDDSTDEINNIDKNKSNNIDKEEQEQEEEEEEDNTNTNITSDDDETNQIINNINNINNYNSEECIGGEGNFHLNSGVCVIPHPNKRHKGGEDAYFISIDQNVIGVADGVGGWGDVGIDPSEYSNTLMKGSKIGADSQKVERDPLIIMEQGYQYAQDVKGSSTCCIVVLSATNNILSANLGDSGFLVIRNNEVIFRTREQQHAFNMPFQLGTQSIDRPIHSITASFPAEKGDLIIMGTDGVFDNLFDDEILEIGEKYDDPQIIARQVAKRAFEVGCSTTIYTPFAKNAGHNGYIYNGGKLDDITVVVGLVDDGPLRPVKPDLLLLDEEVAQ